MNAEQLLQHFERVSEAPDALPRLRRFILDLAVRGKLVEQDPSDEPTSELLKRIAAEKARLNRKERSKRAAKRLIGDDEPIRVPQGWALAPLADLVTVLNGRAYKQQELLSAGTPVLRVGNLFTSDKWYYSTLELDEDKYCEKGDLIFAWSASFGPFIWDGRKVIYHYHIWKLPLHSEANLSKLYLYNFLLQKTREIKEAGLGISMIHMTKEKMERLQVPLPPLAEQHRIVAKVDELMSLCDQLEAAKAEREQCRDSLVAACLQGLNQPAEEEETFREHARFTFNNLPRITTRVDQIKQLRQTILNLAVRGKLVEQDPSDEPAAELALMIKKRSRGQIQESIEPPFGLPVGWAWRAIDTLADKVTDGEHATPPRILEAQIPLVTAKNVREGFMDYSKTDWVSLETAQKAWVRCRPQVGDLLLVCVGATTGRLTVLREPRDMVLVRSVALIRPNSSVLAEFLERGIRSPLLQQQIWASVKAAAQPCLYINRIQSLLIPLPPLAEQHRIVAKVDELMAICDQLEAEITVTEQDGRRFLESVLAEALSPAGDLSAQAQVA